MLRYSVLIPAFNEEQLLAHTLAAVRDSFLDIPESNYEVIVCDNNSTDGTASVALATGARVVFESHNQISRARNRAAAEASGEWLVFIDADTILNPALLRRTMDAIASGKFVGGGSTLRFDRARIGIFAAGLTAYWNLLSRAFGLAAGSYLFCLREAWVAVGGFDESFYAAEEIVFSRRIKRWGRTRGLGFRIIADAPIVTSARKMEWYSQWELLCHMLRAARPGALRRADSCRLWYRRPGDG